jgi:hypothetical protein
VLLSANNLDGSIAKFFNYIRKIQKIENQVRMEEEKSQKMERLKTFQRLKQASRSLITCYNITRYYCVDIPMLGPPASYLIKITGLY